jgi:protein-S-isoprenylcysteine O-methyltransferase Ste14
MKASEVYFAARGWILAAALVALLVARATVDAAEAPLRPVWLSLVLCGIVLRGWAGVHLGTHGNAARAQAPELATAGPYRFSRNPLYLSNLLVAAGLIFYAHALPPFASVLFFLAIFLHHAILVHHEERVLAERFGATYDAYRRDTARWLGLAKTGGNKTFKGAGGSPRASMLRQGRNVAYALAGVFLVWAAATWF